MRSERVDFAGSQGARLSGRLELPDRPPRAYALFAHCFTCSKDVVAASRVSRALTEHGLAVLRFDFTGLGASGGDFSHTDFSSNVEDLVHAAQHLRATAEPPTILIGHSLGGAAVLAAAERLPGTRAVVTIGAPAGTEHVTHLIDEESRRRIEEHGEAEVCLASRTFRIRRDFLEDVAAQPQEDRIRRLDAALLVMHSPQDETVGVDNARLIYDAARHPKSFVSLDGADHLLTRARDARFAASVLAAWVDRYLDPEDAGDAGDEERGDPVPPAGASDGTVVVAESGAGRLGQHVTVGRHTLRADEPVPVGTDDGPTPYDLLVAALGTCTSMTVRMYADRKGWPLEHVTVSLRHGRIHARDCEDCETETGHVDDIERTIRLEGALDEEQRTRLLEIADRCPVHRTLHGEVRVRTSLVTEDAG